VTAAPDLLPFAEEPAPAPDAGAAGYTASDLVALEGLDPVRKRPGMYIGSTDGKGLTHLAFEIVDNAVDEALAGHCTRIEVTLHRDGSVAVADDGRGIPVDAHDATGLSGVEMVLTKLHAGGKFGGGGYKTAGGLHGVGASVVNALSVRLDAEVVRDGKRHTASFSRGVTGVFAGSGPRARFTPRPGLSVAGRTPRGASGTTIRWWHDPTVFPPDARLDVDAVRDRLRQTAYLVPGLALVLLDRRGEEPVEETFRHSGGLVDMVAELAPDRPVCDPVHVRGTGTFKETVPVLDAAGHLSPTEVVREVMVDVALQWGTGYDTSLRSFVNVVRTGNGGSHQKGLERALSRTLIDAVRAARGLLRPKEDLPTLDDVLEGLTAAVAVQVPEPQFVGQTKDELGTAAVARVVADVVGPGLRDWLEGRRTRAQARQVLEKIIAAARVRVAQKQQKDAARRKTALEGASMPPKLVDCRSTDTTRTELWVVEGDSALGTGRAARSAEFQALLPIRGKILNVQKAGLADVFKNVECQAIIQVIGAGSGRTFDPSQMRYGRTVLAADADVDGAHIRCLLITLFARYMRPVLDEGRLFAAMPPLHKIEVGGRQPETLFTYTAEEMTRTVAGLEAKGRSVRGVSRFKGLGEMDADEFRRTTMDPATRSVRRITAADAEAAEQMLELLMGDKVEPRREWLMAHSADVDREAVDA